jgi:hypothetical protein
MIRLRGTILLPALLAGMLLLGGRPVGAAVGAWQGGAIAFCVEPGPNQASQIDDCLRQARQDGLDFVVVALEHDACRTAEQWQAFRAALQERCENNASPILIPAMVVRSPLRSDAALIIDSVEWIAPGQTLQDTFLKARFLKPIPAVYFLRYSPMDYYFWQGFIAWKPTSWPLLPTRTAEPWQDRIAMGWHTPGIVGGLMHRVAELGKCKPLTWIRAEPDAGSITQALRQGRVVAGPRVGPMIRSFEIVDAAGQNRASLGGFMNILPHRTLKIACEVSSPQPARLELLRNGLVVGTHAVDSELRVVRWTVEADRYGLWQVRVRAGQGVLAVSGCIRQQFGRASKATNAYCFPCDDRRSFYAHFVTPERGHSGLEIYYGSDWQAAWSPVVPFHGPTDTLRMVSMNPQFQRQVESPTGTFAQPWQFGGHGGRTGLVLATRDVGILTKIHHSVLGQCTSRWIVPAWQDPRTHHLVILCEARVRFAQAIALAPDAPGQARITIFRLGGTDRGRFRRVGVLCGGEVRPLQPGQAIPADADAPLTVVAWDVDPESKPVADSVLVSLLGAEGLLAGAELRVKPVAGGFHLQAILGEDVLQPDQMYRLSAVMVLGQYQQAGTDWAEQWYTQMLRPKPSWTIDTATGQCIRPTWPVTFRADPAGALRATITATDDLADPLLCQAEVPADQPMQLRIGSGPWQSLPAAPQSQGDRALARWTIVPTSGQSVSIEIRPATSAGAVDSSLPKEPVTLERSNS